MSNLTAREKAFMYAITLLIIIVLGYFFGIRTLNNKYDDYKEELQTLQEKKEFLDQLRENNVSMDKEIQVLEASCKELELSFIDKLETECLQQYVLKTFEDEGCPFLININSADVGMSSVTYPDGTTSPDGLVCMQIGVSYSTTDGYTVTQYNRTPDFTEGAQIPAEETIAELATQMGQGDYAKRTGYHEFLSALKKIANENPSCIKVTSITATEEVGIMTVSATINFYGTSLRNRLSVDDSTKPYTSWTGHRGVDTKGGFIGFPYICDYKDSLWYGCVTMNLKEGSQVKRPFAAYWANVLFDAQLEAAGGDIKVLLNFEGEETPAETQPAT